MRLRKCLGRSFSAGLLSLVWFLSGMIAGLAGDAAAAGPVTFELSAAGGRLEGDTTYQIGGHVDFHTWPYESGDVRFPISELKFPLDVYTGTVAAKVKLFDRLEFKAAVTTNLTDDAGKMEDSDWGYYRLAYGPPFQEDTLDIYSESDTVLTALMVDAGARYFFLRRNWVSLGAGIGYRYQKFEYDIKNLVQEYPSYPLYFGQATPPDVVPGLVSTYEVTYQIPYLEAMALFEPVKGLTLSAALGFSPLAKADDEDDHILRYKRGSGDCDGTAVLFETAVRYAPVKWFFTELGVGLMAIDTDGTQTQTFYRTTEEANAGDSLDIEQEITSRQYSGNLVIGFCF